MLARIQRLLDERIIRQVTPIFDTRALGYQSMLVAAKVDAENPHRAAKVINAHPGVSHNYLRNHEFNLWFTIAVEPDSKLGLEGTLDVLAEATGAESIRQLPTLKLFKIRMDLEMEGAPRRWPAAEAVEPIELDPRPTTTDIAVIRATQGAMPVVPEPYAPAAERLGITQDEVCAHLESLQERGGCCAASPRSSSTAAPASRPTAWASGRSPTSGSSTSAARWPPTAASRTATSGRPTPDWPYSVFTMAHGRSKEECDAILDSIADGRPGSRTARRSTRSTEFKKIRLLYFTDDFKRWEARARRMQPHVRAASSLPDARSAELYRAGAARAAGRRQLAGARDALDRARPALHRRAAAGAELIDVDGNRYVDYVCSWGPLIHGHAHPDGRRGGRSRAAATARRSARRPPARSSWPSVVARVPGGRDAAHDLLRHRGVDERRPPRARRDRPRASAEVRRRLPRPRRRPARRGRLGPRHAGHPRVPRRPGRGRRADGRRALERPRGGRAACAEHEFAAILAEPYPANMGLVPPRAASSRLLREQADATGALLVFDEVITGFRVARGGAQELTGVTPDLTVMGKVLGGGLPAAAYGGPPS